MDLVEMLANLLALSVVCVAGPAAARWGLKT